ncbi:hypothetical protein Goarm_007944 [Gossypium armourianum]|uniref:Uncharacterized protein n=1 Tax=Gossypium armourianum TaxID=34283 RepID=A0A7J9JNE0_9ROSI|nr:hypothetical protein [Gossypium armourianum]
MIQEVNTPFRSIADDYRLLSTSMKVPKLWKSIQASSLKQDLEEPTPVYQISSMTIRTKHCLHHFRVDVQPDYQYQIVGIIRTLIGDLVEMNAGSPQLTVRLGSSILALRLHRPRVCRVTTFSDPVGILLIIWLIHNHSRLN